MQWFRFHADALDDPKVQKLDPATFKGWVNLLCLACKHDGKLPSHDDIAFALRIDVFATESLLDRLVIAGLIDVVKGGANGSHIAPHGWDERQYKSDTSTDRVKRFRERSKTVTVTPPETDTDTEQNIEPNGSCPSGDEPAFTVDHFIEFWNDRAGAWGKARIRDASPERRKLVAARIAQHGLDGCREVFAKFGQSDFLQNAKGIQFDWLIQKRNFQKALEGNYDG